MTEGIRPEQPAAAGQPQAPKVKKSRLGGLWTGFIIAAVVFLLLLVFILENNHDVEISYFGITGSLPLGVALLLAAISGVLLVAIPGYAKILQYKRAVKRN